MRSFLVFAALAAAAYGAHENEHLGQLHLEHGLQKLTPEQWMQRSSEEQQNPRWSRFSSSSSEEQKPLARFEALHQIHQGVKSSSSSSEEKQQLGQARWSFPVMRSGLMSSSSSEETRPIQHGIDQIKDHLRVRRETLGAQKASSSSSSSEEKKPLARFEALHQIHQGVKSSSSSSEEKQQLGQARWSFPVMRSGLMSSSSSEETKPIQHTINKITGHPLVRRELFHGLSKVSSSSSSEEQKRPTGGRFFEFYSRERDDVAKGRDELHKIQHFEHISSKERLGGAPIPGPTVLEGTYHVAYDPPTVVQAPVIGRSFWDEIP